MTRLIFPAVNGSLEAMANAARLGDSLADALPIRPGVLLAQPFKAPQEFGLYVTSAYEAGDCLFTPESLPGVNLYPVPRDHSAVILDKDMETVGELAAFQYDVLAFLARVSLNRSQ